MASLAPAAARRAAIYARVSTPGQREDGYSLDGQVAECVAVAERLGVTVEPHLIYRECGSGANWNLPALLELLERAKRREFDVLVCLATSRLARDVGKLTVLHRTLKRYGITIHYAHHTFDDSPTGELTGTVLAAIDVYERQNIGLRFTLGKQAKAARGLVMGIGPAPYGYQPVKNDKGRTVGLQVDPGTAAVVQRIFRDVCTMPLQRLCEALDADSVPTPAGAPGWTRNTIRGIISNPVYTGRAPYGRRAYQKVLDETGADRQVYTWRDADEVHYAEVPAVVTRQEAEAATAALTERRTRRAGRQPDSTDPFTLRSLLTCGLCDEPLAVQFNRQLRYYECLRHRPSRARAQRRDVCALPAVPADADFDSDGHPRGIEAEAWRVVRDTLLDADYMRAAVAEARQANAAATRRAEQVKELRTEIAACRKRLDRQMTELLDPDLGVEAEQSLRRAAKEIERKLDRLKESQAALEATPVAGLSDDDAVALEQFAAEVVDGFDLAAPSDLRRLYGILRLRGVVQPAAEDGLRLKRQRFSIEWTAVIKLRRAHGMTGRDC